MSVRHRKVAVAVVYDPQSQGFLLCHNKRWNGYAFPMKHFEGGGENSQQAALLALNDGDGPLSVAQASATPLDSLVKTLWSEAVREVTVYEYDVYAVDLGGPLPSPLHPDWRFFSYDELQSAFNVTSSTKEIARSFVDDRRIAVAVITRPTPAGPEYLVVHNPNYGYFFPSTRMKTDAYPADAAVEAAHLDVCEDVNFTVVAQAPDVPSIQHSSRFGKADRHFHYHICLLEVPGVDLNSTGNVLEEDLNERAAVVAESSPAPYWRWCTAEELQSDPQMSSSMTDLRLTVLQIVSEQRRE